MFSETGTRCPTDCAIDQLEKTVIHSLFWKYKS